VAIFYYIYILILICCCYGRYKRSIIAMKVRYRSKSALSVNCTRIIYLTVLSDIFSDGSQGSMVKRLSSRS